MLYRESELDAFKRVDLSVIASSFGFVVEKKRTTRSTVMMSNGSEKIAISYNGNHFVYWTVGDDRKRQGTVIDFIQTAVEPGANMGRVRQLLRPFLNSGYMASVRQDNKGKYATKIEPYVTDFQAVAKRFSRFVPIAEPHPYLCNERGIPAELLQSLRIFGRIRQDKQGNVTAPHWGCPDGEQSEKRGIVGYELIGPNLKMFSKSGTKSLWMSVGMKEDNKLAVAESFLDALSFMTVHGEHGLRVASISGQMNSQQPDMIRSAIAHLGSGEVIAAFDNDAGGDKLTQTLAEIVRSVGNAKIVFTDKRPQARGSDWNKVLMDQQRKLGRLQAPSLGIGR